MHPFTYKRTVGVVGIGNSGKTVLLTSLISHLKNHHPELLRLHPGSKKQPAEIICFEERSLPGMKIPMLPHEKYYNSFRHEMRWPDKTADALYYHCTFQRRDWSWTDVELTFIDFPGERFNDLLMLDEKMDYAGWSTQVLDRLESHPKSRALAADYLATVKTQLSAHSPDAEAVLRAYRLLLARLMQNYSAFITPSVFALDTRGRMPDNHPDPARVAAGRLLGLNEESQFAPLPSMEEDTPLHPVFRKSFDQYRKALIRPHFDLLRRCDLLLVLVDIPGLLAGNVGRFNDTEQVIGDVLAAAGRKRGFGIFSFRNLKKVAFVATKSDTIQPRDSDRLRALLKELVWHKARNHPDLPHQLFTCAAVQSTHLDAKGELEGYPVWSPEGRLIPPPTPDQPMHHLHPSRLPECWPEHWQAGDYAFPEVWPLLPARRNLPPRHLGLNAIVDFILES